MATQCQGTSRNGQPCSAHVYEGDSFCRWHDPGRADERKAWAEKGGRNRSNRARARKQLADQAMSIDDLDALLCLAIKQVSVGRMEPGVGSSMANIAKTITTIRSAGDFEKRLEELERAAGVGNVRRFGA
jgi:hypothetical protein